MNSLGTSTRLLTLALVLVAAGCGDDDDPITPDGGGGGRDAGPAADAPASPDAPMTTTDAGGPADGGSTDVPMMMTSSEALIGAAGGKVSSPDGSLTVEIPRGALTTAITVRITRVTDAMGVVGSAYVISPEGTRFAMGKPAIVTWRPSDLGGASSVQVATFRNGGWTELDEATFASGTARGILPVLGRVALVTGVCRTCTSACEDTTCRFGVTPGMPTSGVQGRCLSEGMGCKRCVPLCDTDGDGACPGNPGNDQPGGDCNDNNRNVGPNAREICGNGVDDNCNSHTDEGCKACAKDAECTAGLEACLDGVCAVCEGSCNMENCRFGVMDGMPMSGVAGRCAQYGTGCQRCVPACDKDGDGYCPGSPDNGQPGGDCNDNDIHVAPKAFEVCGNTVDDDCDGAADDGCKACTKGSDCPMNQRCEAGACVGCPAACEMAKCRFGANPAVAGSGIAGRCQVTGNGCSVCVPACDTDGDGACPGNPGSDQPGGDCNDNDANIGPNATEICGNGVDDNCNSHTDEGCKACVKDAECSAGLEACIDGVCGICDGNCNMENCRFGVKDGMPMSGVAGKCAAYGRGCQRCVPACDMDGDGHCAGMPSDDQPGGDCNDMDASIGPKSPESCGNKVDDDCDGRTDEGCATCASAAMCSTLESCSSAR